MGKVKMKKKTSILVAIMMLVSVALVLLPLVSAANPCTIRGYVYVDGVITTPDEIKLIISDKEIIADLFETPTGYYNIMVDASVGETGIFHVTIPEGTWKTDETITIQNGVYLYKINLTIDTLLPPINNAPNVPSNPNPANGTINVGINAAISWQCSDPDGDPLTYDVYFGTSNSPTAKVSTQSATTYDPAGVLNYNTPYYWKIVATDNHGASTTGAIWSFTTKAEDQPAPPGGGGSSGGTPNPPTAKANGPYFGFLIDGAAEISFTASGSTGTITSYSWNFGDGNTGTGASPKHSYTAAGNFTVVLTVTGPDGSDTDNTYVVISAEPNYPPSDPEVTGTPKGTKNTEYNYTAMSTDIDSAELQYIFDWGDGDTNTTEFLPNGTMTTQTHKWAAVGIYAIGVKAYDNETQSGTTHYTVLIDTIYVKDIGYLIDTDGDGTYDVFHSNATNAETTPEKQDNGTYLINSDGVNGWDWIYDPTLTPDTLTPYSTGSSGEAKADNTLWYALSIGVILAIVLLVIIYLATRKKQKPKK